MTQIELHVEDTRGSRRPLPIVHEDSFDEYSRDEINNASTPKELRDKIARGGMLRVHIDPFNYDVAPEADEEMRCTSGALRAMERTCTCAKEK